MIDVIDDYLSEEDHKLIYDYFTGAMDQGDLSNSCAWIFFPGTTTIDDGHFHFTQLIFAQHSIISPAFNMLTPIIKQEEMTAIARIKANCVLRTPELIEFTWGFHTDFNNNEITAIYYINDNDGYTLFEDGTKVESVANRFVRFPCTTRHTGTTCTNTDRRLLINFNYHV